MKIVETGGLFHYEVSGENENAAAEELERTLDIISRQYWQSERNNADDRHDAVNKVAEKYGVKIRAEV